MCFITHNRLIILISIVSFLIGILNLITSAVVVHYSDELFVVTVHVKFLVACTFFTIGAGIIQAVSALLYLFRRVITRHWIGANAVVFGIFLLGMCTAMVRFQSTLPDGFNPVTAVANRTQYPNEVNTTDSIATEYLLDISNGSKTDNEYDPDQQSQEVDFGSMEGDIEDNTSRNSDIKIIQEIVETKTHLLKLYFGVVIADFLSLPIFLGLVSSKASKFDIQGKSHIGSW